MPNGREGADRVRAPRQSRHTGGANAPLHAWQIPAHVGAQCIDRGVRRDRRESSHALRPCKSDPRQRLQVELRVDRGGLELRVSEHVRDLLEGGAAPDHLGGGGVPQDMGAWARHMDAGATKDATSETTDRLPGKRRERRPVHQENPSLHTSGSPESDVGGECCAHLIEQGKAALAAGLVPADDQTTATPINVLEADPRPFAPPEAQAREKEDDGAIAELSGCRMPQSRNHALEVIGLQMPWNGSETPLAHRRNCALESGPYGAGRNQESERGARSGHGQSRSGRLEPCSFARDEADDVVSGELRPVERARTRIGLRERPSVPEIIVSRPRGRPAYLIQVLIEAAKPSTRLGCGRACRRRNYDIALPHELHCLASATADVTYFAAPTWGRASPGPRDELGDRDVIHLREHLAVPWH